MTDPNPTPLPQPLDVELVEQPPSRVQLFAVVGIVAGLLLGMAGIIVLSYAGRDTPDVLDVTLGALAGSLASLLLPRRG